MPDKRCPRCDAVNFWTDDLWGWGCNVCGYLVGPDGSTFATAKEPSKLPSQSQQQAEHYDQTHRQ